MDLATLVGIIGSFAVVIAAMLMGGTADMFINVPSLMIRTSRPFLRSDCDRLRRSMAIRVRASRSRYGGLLTFVRGTATAITRVVVAVMRQTAASVVSLQFVRRARLALVLMCQCR